MGDDERRSATPHTARGFENHEVSLRPVVADDGGPAESRKSRPLDRRKRHPTRLHAKQRASLPAPDPPLERSTKASGWRTFLCARRVLSQEIHSLGGRRTPERHLPVWIGFKEFGLEPRLPRARH